MRLLSSRFEGGCEASAIAHTWRNDLRRRVQLYMEEYLRNPQAAQNIFGTMEDTPQDIPFYFKVTKVSGRVNKATAIAIYVGKSHCVYMEKLLATIPFPDVEMVLLSQNDKPQIFSTSRFFFTQRYVKEAALSN